MPKMRIVAKNIFPDATACVNNSHHSDSAWAETHKYRSFNLLTGEKKWRSGHYPHTMPYSWCHASPKGKLWDVWGCVNAFGKGNLHFYSSGTVAEKYIKILKQDDIFSWNICSFELVYLQSWPGFSEKYAENECALILRKYSVHYVCMGTSGYYTGKSCLKDDHSV